MIALAQSLRACVPCLSESFRAAHPRLLEDESLARLADRLLAIARDGVPVGVPPRFDAEVTPPLADAWAFFQGAVTAWEQAADRVAPEVLRGLAGALETAGCRNALVLMGQRLTPASLTDDRGVPTTRTVLLGSANALHNAADGLTVAARALTKHVHRSPEAFWGEVRGSASAKNALAASLLERILDGATWWNVFGHYQHEVVFEARLPSGHGARWSAEGGEFIGFLEPFLPTDCREWHRQDEG